MDVDDLNQTLAERRSRREHRLPKRYRDVLPERPAALPPTSQPSSESIPPASASPSAQAMPPAVSASQGSSVLSRVRRLLKSTRNVFGLFRQYHATQFPEHDPDEDITLDDLMDKSSDLLESYHPYPTRSSFLLGEWYWNDGIKKSQSSFKNLVNIIGQQDFRPEDVAKTNWRSVDAQLGGDSRRKGSSCEGGEDGWEDEQEDKNWAETPVKIKVPFYNRSLHPGQKEFEVGTLRHRKLVSVIREKISTPSSFRHLHFEPYKLYWQPTEASEPLRVHNELYSSEAFIDAHRELQDSPGELGCELPRVVIGLMFASDSTHLTAFSDAKLWPLYLTIGNESKDRRSKPSCQAFEHIAYLQKVGTRP